MDLKLSTRLHISFGLILSLVTAYSLFSSIATNNTTDSFIEYRQTARSSLSVNDIKDAVLDTRLAVMKYRIDKDVQRVEDVKKDIRNMNAARDRAAEVLKDQTHKETVEVVKSDLDDYSRTFIEAVSYNEKRNKLVEKLDNLGPEMRKNITNLNKSAFSDGDTTAAYYGGLVQEHLILARLYAAKFLISNKAADASRMFKEIKEAQGAVQALTNELQNPERRRLAGEVSDQLKEYRDVFEPVIDAIEARNELLVTQLDSIGPKILENVDGVLNDIVRTQNDIGPQIQAEMQRGNDVTKYVAFVVVALGILIAFFFGRELAQRLAQVASSTQRLSEGELDIEIADAARNDEIGLINRALLVFKKNALEKERLETERQEMEKNAFIEAELTAKKQSDVQKALEAEKEKLLEEDWLKTAVAEISENLQQAQTSEDLSEILLNKLAEKTNAQIGAFYIRDGLGDASSKDEDTPTFSLQSSYAFTHRKKMETRYEEGESLVGQAAKERKAIILSDVPDDYIAISSGTGKIAPKNIIVVPLVFEKYVVGVLEIGLLKSLSEPQQELIEQVLLRAGVILNIIISRLRTEKLLEISRKQAEILSERESALKQANIDMEEAANLAQQASKAKSEFLANMSHELRTPLNSLLLLAQELTENELGNLTEEQIEDSKIIHNSGKDLLALINDILDLSKVEAGQMEANIEDFALSEMTANIEANFMPVAKNRDLYLKINLAKGLPETLRSDRIRIEQILRNFLSNAFKFTHEGGVTLDIFAAEEPDMQGMIAFAVKDTGIGIPQHKLEAVFDVFQQVDSSTSRKYGGTGLGLSISREFSALLGGSVTAKSNEGEGSVFTLYLPGVAPGNVSMQAPDQGRLDQQDATALADNTYKTPTKTSSVSDDRDTLKPEDKVILIVEDDPIFAKILREKIHDQGHKCLISANGLPGLQLAHEYNPDAIILDVELPDINGLDLHARLKKDSKLKDIPIYFMSAHDDLPTMVTNEVVGYLTKPVDAEQLRTALGQIEDAMRGSVNHVLVVEDNKILSGIITTLLEKKGIRVTNAEDGKAALDALHEEMPDCMLLDLGLPDMTGIEVLERIEQSDQIMPPRVLVSSGRDVSEEERGKLSLYTKSFIKTNGQTPEDILEGLASIKGPIPQAPVVKMQKPTKTNDAAKTGAHNFEGCKILLVDDESRNIFALSRIVSKTGAEIHTAQNGQEAINFLNENPDTDIVLMDIMMPVMDGYEAIKLIRKQERFVHMPIVAVTAKAMKGDDNEAFEAGASAYIPKPIDKAVLLKTMNDLYVGGYS